MTRQYKRQYFASIIKIIKVELELKSGQRFTNTELHNMFKYFFLLELINNGELHLYKKTDKQFTTELFTTEQFAIYREFVIDYAIKIFKISPESFLNL